jgi:hypothetical protein
VYTQRAEQSGGIGMRRRYLAAVFAAAIIVTVLSACSIGGGGAKSGGAAVEALLPKTSRALHWVGGVAPAGGTLATVAEGLGSAIDKGTSIKTQYQKIAASDDPFGEAFVSATCYGLTNISSQYQQDPSRGPASAQRWENFLKTEIEELLPNTAAATISQKVTQFNNAAHLESINPRYADYYVKECVLRPGRRGAA